MKDRRHFLKLFGLSSAAIATVNAQGETKIEKLTDAEAPAVGPQYRREEYWRNLQNVSDVRTGWLYSALNIPKNSMKAQYHSLFQDSMYTEGPSGAIQHVTYADTNMCRAGQLCAPEAFAVRRIGILFSPTTIPALRSAFAERYAVQFFLGKKFYWSSPVSAMFSTGEIENIDRTSVGFVDLDIPLIIANQMSFGMSLVGTPLPVHGRIRLWGVLGDRHLVGVS